MEWFGLLVILYFAYSAINEKFFKNKITYTDATGKKVSENLQRRQPKQFVIFEKPDIEITPEVQNILNKLENSKENIFLTGKAGTGKSTVLRYFRATTKKKYAVAAPTGIAAINVQGQTIHSFFGFGIDITPDRVKYVSADKLKVLRNLDSLIIDEISMVRADLLDCIDASLRKNRRSDLPFGGVQIIAIGDPYQLPPVVKTSEYKYFHTIYPSPHFFSAKSYARGKFITLELTKVYRQKDDVFIEILNSVRVGDVTVEQIQQLNEITTKAAFDDSIKLVTTNALATTINNSEIQKLKGDGNIYKGFITGDFNEKSIPTDMELTLKEGARVMLLNNDKRRRWVNGDVGTVISLGQNSVKIKFDDNTFDEVELNEWDNVKFIYDEEEGKIVPEIVGKYIQLPLKLAWALTIHKSQGKQYDHVHVDFGTGTFAPGQAYVALSRCVALEGLTFAAPLVLDDIITDSSVKKFMGVVRDEVVTHTIGKKTDDKKAANVSKSDLNKLDNFMKYPEKYATGSDKAGSKVVDAAKTFNLIKDNLTPGFQKEFYDALERYTNALESKGKVSSIL